MFLESLIVSIGKIYGITFGMPLVYLGQFSDIVFFRMDFLKSNLKAIDFQYCLDMTMKF